MFNPPEIPDSSRCSHDGARGFYKGVFKPGKGPHAFKLVCERCGKFVKWVSRQEHDIKTKAGPLIDKLFGAPNGP